MALKVFRVDDNKVVGVDGRANRTVVNLSKNKKSKKLMYMPNIEDTREPNFSTPNAKKTFSYLRLAFIKASIFWNFDLESYIWIETNVSGYSIGEVLSQLNFKFDASLNDLNKSDFS